MALKIEDDAKRARELLARLDVREAMAIRCAESGHEWEGACSVMFQIYRLCKWCEATC